MIFLVNWGIFRFHVDFQGCKSNQNMIREEEIMFKNFWRIFLHRKIASNAPKNQENTDVGWQMVNPQMNLQKTSKTLKL